ncbi:pyridoxal-phosphate dependent enzyme [Massilia sp. CMS3.1]|uniref:pyridoxal-phosphate dependent enzyme n=1 Tax=Massilia sp. CMS3.1 TaxID=3373083 RepID=UPI003EE47901
MALHIDTPLLASTAFPQRRVWLKMEALQPSGSFKLRGIGHACATYAARGARRIVASSGGNAGLAAAYAGRELGLPVLVVVPETTSERARALLAREEAEVCVHGLSFQEANAHAQSLLGPQDAFIHPFDDPLLWEGHAGMIDEVARCSVRPDAVVLAVGGGGLLSGTVAGLRRQGWNEVPVFAVETVGADSYAQSLAAGKRVELAAIASIATSLGARKVSEHAFDLARTHPITPIVVTDREAVTACLRFMDDHRVVVEPACGAALALAYQADGPLIGFENLLVIVCGGATATVAQLQVWDAQLG